MRKFGKRSGQWGPKVLELDTLSLGAWGFLQDLYNCGVSSCASSPGKLGRYQAPLPLLKSLGTRQHQLPLKTTGKTYQVWAWIKINRKSEQSRRTLKSSWVRKSVSETKPKGFGDRVNSQVRERKLRWVREWVFREGEVTNEIYTWGGEQRKKWSGLSPHRISCGPQRTVPLTMGHQTEQVFISWFAVQGQWPTAWASLEVYCVQATRRGQHDPHREDGRDS